MPGVRNPHDDDDDDDYDDDASTARHDTLSRRLYRILMRSCKRCGAERAEDQSWILLQPTLDPQRYGFARIVSARRGGDYTGGGGGGAIPSSSSSSSSSSSPCELEYHNPAAARMSDGEVGMAMEVLRFAHASMGGDPDDDLEEYYLGIRSDDGDIDEGDAGDGGGGGGDIHVDGGGDVDAGGGERVAGEQAVATTAAAGRHSEGHYTQFLDEDPERGERGGDVGDVRSEADAEWDSDDDSDEDDKSVLVTPDDLQNAVRLAFRAPLVPPSSSRSRSADDDGGGGGGEEPRQSPSIVIARRHRDAIDACSKLSEQCELWGGKSSVSVDRERGVRVVATSTLMTRPASAPGRVGGGAMGNYRFAYRIRVENIFDIVDRDDARKEEEEEGKQRDDDEGEMSTGRHKAVQLLGRTWVISEREPKHETTSSKLKRLLEVGLSEEGVNSTRTPPDQLRVVQTVNEPRTGAGKFFGDALFPLSSVQIECAELIHHYSWAFSRSFSRRGNFYALNFSLIVLLSESYHHFCFPP
jgi:hypothetical protein